jgi:hypothetical protein
MSDYDAPLPPIESMTPAQMKAEVLKLRGDKTGRKSAQAQTTKKKNVENDYMKTAKLLKSLSKEQREEYATKLGKTLEEFDAILKEA